jgi:hypothetical protein
MPSLESIVAEDARKLFERGTLTRTVCLYRSSPTAVMVVKGPGALPSMRLLVPINLETDSFPVQGPRNSESGGSISALLSGAAGSSMDTSKQYTSVTSKFSTELGRGGVVWGWSSCSRPASSASGCWWRQQGLNCTEG